MNTYHCHVQDPKTFDQFDSTITSSYLLNYLGSGTAPTPAQAGQTSRICPLILISIMISLIYNDRTLFTAQRAALEVLFPGSRSPCSLIWIVSSKLEAWWSLNSISHFHFCWQHLKLTFRWPRQFRF